MVCFKRFVFKDILYFKNIIPRNRKAIATRDRLVCVEELSER